MINLLATDLKNEYRAARQNVILRRYIYLVLLVLALMVAIFGVGYYLTYHEKQIADKARQEQIDQTDDYKSVRTAAEAYSKNLVAAKKILGNQTKYSSFLTSLASTLPKNVIMTQLNISPPVGGKTAGKTVFSARAKSYGDVLTLKQKLEDSPLLEDVSITSTQKTSGSGDYTVDATLSVVISKGALEGSL